MGAVMKKFLLATTSVLALAQAATAADLPARVPVKAPAPVVVPVATWTGFYLGIQGGVVSHRGRFNDTSTDDDFFGGWQRQPRSAAPLVATLDSTCSKARSFSGSRRMAVGWVPRPPRPGPAAGYNNRFV